MTTLYISDMDGTLLDADAHVSATSAQIITNLTRRGALITVATARTPATVEPLLAGVETATEAVTMTGAAIWNRKSKRFEDTQLMPLDQTNIILDIFKDSPIAPFCYVFRRDLSFLDVYHDAPTLTDVEFKFVEARKNLFPKKFHLAQMCSPEERERVVLFFAMGSHADIISVAQRLKLATTCYVSYYMDNYNADTWLLEVFADGVSKSAGIARLRRRIGADRVVVFGDNLNDIAMMKDADLAVAVENALPEVKAIADIVIGPNTADSVARFIEADFNSCAR
jgi:hypothetical protein